MSSAMATNYWSFILSNLEAAGAIGGYVSLSVIGFALISFASKRSQKKIQNVLRPKWIQPVVGAFLGAIPGCGATIVVASLYKNKKISFGGLFATFISTLGEGSFVLLGASNEADVTGNLRAYATITIIGLIMGIFFGCIADILGIRSQALPSNANNTENPMRKEDNNAVLSLQRVMQYAILMMAIFLAPNSIMALWGGGIESMATFNYWISIALTITCILSFLTGKLITREHDCFSELGDLKSTLSHSVIDVAMVVTYVFAGLLIANYIIDILVGPETFDIWMGSSKILVIAIAALIGVTPGCGGMIAVAVAFITIPNFPMPALIAAAIATSGDGIFPLLAENRKDGLLVSFYGLLIALLVGYFTLLIGI